MKTWQQLIEAASRDRLRVSVLTNAASVASTGVMAVNILDIFAGDIPQGDADRIVRAALEAALKEIAAINREARQERNQ